MRIRVVASDPWFGSAPGGGRDGSKEVWPGLDGRRLWVFPRLKHYGVSQG